MKFAHLGDCHLGGWRQPELKELNLKSFRYAVEKCISEKVDFILIAGDLFDSAYPSIETLKEVFREFRRLRESNIPVFLIAGSHDYSVSGKTFLEVLEKSGFCKNVSVFQEKNGFLLLEPTIYKNVAIYGYPGKKSGLEIDDIERLKILDAPGMFKILMLHTTLSDAVKGLPIKSVDEKNLPSVDYVALGHLHIDYIKENRVYSGPLFPNSLSELIELQGGSFYIFDSGRLTKNKVNLKEVLFKSAEITNSIGSAEKLISLFDGESVKDKIVILRVYGVLETGKVSDIDFHKIESTLKSKGCYVFLKSTSKLHTPESDIKIDLNDFGSIESQIVSKFQEKNPNKFNHFIEPLMKSLQIEKNDDEKSQIFEDRLVSEAKKILLL